MAYYCKETGLRIIGISEWVATVFPITRDPDNPESWTYTGEKPKTYWDIGMPEENFNPRTQKTEQTFTRSDGEDLFWDQIKWRDE
jgi:hypothetical protein